MATIIDIYRTEAVRTVIHLVLVNTTTRSGPPRMATNCATSTAFGLERQPDGSLRTRTRGVTIEIGGCESCSKYSDAQVLYSCQNRY